MQASLSPPRSLLAIWRSAWPPSPGRSIPLPRMPIPIPGRLPSPNPSSVDSCRSTPSAAKLPRRRYGIRRSAHGHCHRSVRPGCDISSSSASCSPATTCWPTNLHSHGPQRWGARPPTRGQQPRRLFSRDLPAAGRLALDARGTQPGLPSFTTLSTPPLTSPLRNAPSSCTLAARKMTP
jgi:hypothetical protein